MNRSLGCAALLLIALSFKASADDTVTVCNACADQAMRFRARDLGNGHHYFWDFTTRRLTHYLTQGQTIPPASFKADRAASDRGSIQLIPLTSDEMQLFSYGLDLYDSTGTTRITNTFQTDYTIPANAAQAKFVMTAATTHQATAFDMVNTPVYQKSVIDLVFNQNNLGPFYWLQDRTRVALATFTNFASITLIKTPFTLSNTIQFPDGSSFMVSWDYQTRQYRYVKGFATDAAGNLIPETTNDAGGGATGKINYVYPNTAKGMAAGGEMVDHLTGLNVGWTTPPGVPVNNGFIIACASTPSGVRCTIETLIR
ncbi:hypothetical protein [Xanthomonas prunicola]|uniref:hypothetical protein n=1 Tax=Xanthomonas prunicola TaxID=2053930 RepID=UPI0010551D3F|nr:hypothetical protein [Xanthomonas prunicola]